MKFPILRLLLLSVLLSFVPAGAEELQAPTNFRVKVEQGMFEGRWDAVQGASYYEVWTKLFGQWRFDEKELSSSPFTSSFEMPIQDPRTLFKVRAVAGDGTKGPFGPEVQATRPTVDEPAEEETPTERTPAVTSDFDPKAPPPPPPTSLFAVWEEARVIRLIWQSPEKAQKFTVEEYIDDEWVSVSQIEFPKKNTALIDDHPMPGPYKFRVRAVGRNGRASEPSRPTIARR